MSRLRIERERRQLSQQGLAMRVGISRESVVNYESRGVAPSVYVALRLARELRIPVDELFVVAA